MKNSKLAALRAAFPYTVPIFAGFWFLAMAYGIQMSTSGFSFWYPMIMSAVIYGGSLEFVAVSMLLSPFAPVQTFLMTLMIQARHLFYGISMLDKYKNTGWKKFYLIFGMNDMGLSADTFGQYFSRLVDLIQKSHPDADIYAQAVLPVTELKEQSGAANGFSLAHVKEFNEALMQVCVDKQIWYLDIPKTLVDEKGYLLDDASWDGVHLNASYCRTWLDYLLCHVVLPEDYNGEYDVPTGYHPGDVVMDGVTVYDFKPSN